MTILYDTNQDFGQIKESSFDNNNDLLWFGTDGGDIKAWDYETDSIIYQHSEHNDFITSIAYDPNNNIIWSACFGEDRVLGWDPETSSIAYSHTELLDDKRAMTYDPNNNIIWTSQDEPGKVVGWDIDTQSVAYQHNEHTTDIGDIHFHYSENVVVSTSLEFGNTGIIGYDFGITFEDPNEISTAILEFDTRFEYSENIQSATFDKLKTILFNSLEDGSYTGEGLKVGYILNDGTPVFNRDLNVNDYPKSVEAVFQIFEGDLSSGDDWNEIEIRDNSGTVIWTTTLSELNTDENRSYVIKVEFVSP